VLPNGSIDLSMSGALPALTQVVEPGAPLLGELPERGGEISGTTCCKIVR